MADRSEETLVLRIQQRPGHSEQSRAGQAETRILRKTSGRRFEPVAAADSARTDVPVVRWLGREVEELLTVKCVQLNLDSVKQELTED